MQQILTAYMGKVFIKSWKNEPAQLVIGLHPALITEEIFYKANEVLDGRKRNMIFHEDKADQYPLKGFLKCPTHNLALTAYGARGRNNKPIIITFVQNVKEVINDIRFKMLTMLLKKCYPIFLLRQQQ